MRRCQTIDTQLVVDSLQTLLHRASKGTTNFEGLTAPRVPCRSPRLLPGAEARGEIGVRSG
jgi:hypothetical protein